MTQFSILLVPCLLLLTGLLGLLRGVDVYDGLATGAREGLSIVLRILPPLVGLLTAIAMLRASGCVELLAELLRPLLDRVGIPAETVPLILLRPLSGSGALGVTAELMDTYGPDSPIGRTAAVMMGGTETTFYTISVYFGAAGIQKTRYVIPAALCADIVGFLTAAAAVKLLFG